jgi:hypothetical protein
VVLWCEAHDLERPEQWRRFYPFDEDVPEDVRWAADGPVTFLGNRYQPSTGTDGRRLCAWLVHDATGFMVDHTFAGLTEALRAIFGDAHMPRHVDKLRAHPEVDERHLFLPVHLTGLPDHLGDAVMRADAVPPEPPPLPEGVTHLWLAHHVGERVLVGTADGWTDHHPYDP